VHRPNRIERVQAHRKAGRSSYKVMMEVVRLFSFLGRVLQYHNVQFSIQRFTRFEMHTDKERLIVVTVSQAYILA
jgi:hypothetical protein